MKIESNSNMPIEMIDRVQTLLSTIPGTIPGDRAYGIDPDIQDLPINAFKVRYIAEASSKVKKYIPEIQVVNIDFEEDTKEGILIPRVVIDWI